METIWHDIRYGFKMLLKSPAFTLVALLSIGLGIGINTAIFSVVNAVLFRPLPVISEPDRLVWFRAPISYPSYEEYRDQNDVFTGMTASSGKSEFSLSSDGQPELVQGEFVTANYFSVLGVEASLGRTFLPEEDQTPGAHQVVVISHNLWENRFGADPALIGKTISLNGMGFTVVGIAPKNFIGTEVGIIRELWVPMMMFSQLNPRVTGGDSTPVPDRLSNRNMYWLNTVARLKPDVSREQAESAMTVIADRAAKAHGEQKIDERLRSVNLLPVAGGLDPRDRLDALPLSGLLMAVVGIVLLIACANVASLLLSRATIRQKEIAVRQALGASRSRLIRQLLTESILLALIAGAFGLLLGLWAIDILKALSSGVPLASVDAGLDYRVLGFTLLISLITGIVFGLAPALQASRPDLVPALKNESVMVGSHRRSRLRNAFVIAQVTLSLVLLIGSGLFIRSLQNAQSIDPGFNARNGLTVPVDLGLLRYDEAKGQEFYRQIVERVKTMPGVEQASLVKFVPLGFSFAQREVVIEGSDADDSGVSAGFNIVGRDYFQTMGVSILRGREFKEDDREKGVIINETFAARFFSDKDPIGKRVSLNGLKGPYSEIVGVAKDGKYSTLGERARPFIYQPLLQSYESRMTLVVRTTTDPTALTDAVRSQIQALEPNLPVAKINTLAEQVNTSLLPARLTATLLGVFGLLALCLAAVGIYGVVAYSVSQRTHEIGIRMALGARSGDVLKLVLREGLGIVTIEIAIGLGIAFVATQLISSFLYGVSATDPITFVGISLLLTVVALGACFVPARRATKVDPMVALRYE
ncbi:MAG TPA: ABC transporter permease [Blastocatellia bacterium]|nr:ABC transporter permease [Blastocatellia bacterium]